MDFVYLTDIAIQAAQAAGKIIQQHMNKAVTVVRKVGGTSYASQVVTEVDKACEKVSVQRPREVCRPAPRVTVQEPW